MEIVPLSPALWPKLTALFEEGGDPRWCWCTFWRVRARDFSNSTADANRDHLRGLVKAGSGSDSSARLPGLVAVESDRVIGWVSLGPRSDFDRLEHSRVRPRLDDRPVWSIVCFVVSRKTRRQGVAGRLLHAAVDYARANGAPAVEAYPVDTAGGKVPAANLYTGAWSTFEAAGFSVAREVDSPQATVRRLIVRREL
jgi:GNAT superfamily N-acetyltransferase